MTWSRCSTYLGRSKSWARCSRDSSRFRSVRRLPAWSKTTLLKIWGTGLILSTSSGNWKVKDMLQKFRGWSRRWRRVKNQLMRPFSRACVTNLTCFSLKKENWDARWSRESARDLTISLRRMVQECLIVFWTICGTIRISKQPSFKTFLSSNVQNVLKQIRERKLFKWFRWWSRIFSLNIQVFSRTGVLSRSSLGSLSMRLTVRRL